jgi:hypothetical protein
VYVVVDSWNCDANGEQCVAGGAIDESDEANNLLAAPVVAPRTTLP